MHPLKSGGDTVAEPAQRPSTAAAVALVAANLLPLALVLAGLENIGSLMMLYWAENVVIGIFTALRMLTAGRGSESDKAGGTLFFGVHYGGFCLGHGFFIAAMFLSREQQVIGLLSSGTLLLPLLALAVSHGVSFYLHYVRNGRYRTAHPADSFWQPYPRVVLLHLCIIGGAFLITGHGSTVPMLAALVIGKSLIDLTLHRRSNRAG